MFIFLLWELLRLILSIDARFVSDMRFPSIRLHWTPPKKAQRGHPPFPLRGKRWSRCAVSTRGNGATHILSEKHSRHLQLSKHNWREFRCQSSPCLIIYLNLRSNKSKKGQRPYRGLNMACRTTIGLKGLLTSYKGVDSSLVWAQWRPHERIALGLRELESTH